MNELVIAALERSPVPEMEPKPTLSSEGTTGSVISDERTVSETDNNYENDSPPPPVTRAPRPQYEEHADYDETREARTPPHGSTERRAYHHDPTEQEQRYRSSPPPPPSLSSSAAYHHQHQNQQNHQHYQQYPQHPQLPYHPYPRAHQGESSSSTSYYDYSHLSPHAGRGNLNPVRSQHVHPREVLPSAIDSFRSGGCTCKKSRCLKLYCQCFSSSTTCGPKCKCVACHNSTLHADSIETARHTILERNPAAFDDKFQKPAKDMNMNMHIHHGHHAVYGGVDIFATTAATTPTAASWNSSSSRDHQSSIRHQQQQQQHLQHHMPYTFTQQPHQHSTPPPPPLLSTTSSSSSSTASRASATTAPKAYSYTPPAYASARGASSGSGSLPLCLPHTPPHTPPPTLTSSRVNKFGCKCKRSFCLKKYCECFQNATHCGLNCKCTNCKNFPDPNLPTAGASSAATVQMSTSRSDPRKAAMPAMTTQVPITSRTPMTVKTQTSTDDQERQDKDEDRMAMMAAVAMAELSGGLTSKSVASAHEHEQTESYALTPAAPRRNANEREREWNQESAGNKRKAEQEGEKETLSSVPLKKRKPKENLASLADEEVRAVVSSAMSVESRNPSPVSTMRSTYYPPQAADRFPYHHGMPPQTQTGRYPPQQGHGHGYHGHVTHRASPVHHRDPRASPPLAYEYSRAVSARYLQPSPPPNFRNSPPPYVRSSPPPYVRTSPPPLGMYSKGVTPSPYKQSGSYEEVLRSSGLPKALSFRKICSKCGKTRGEHGELGFGNKCVYQECGKCGAGIHMHERAGQPMGVLCCLTTEDGATPLASAIYERKIRELAARADLQRELQRRKEEATQDIVQRCQEAEASAAATKEMVGADVQ